MKPGAGRLQMDLPLAQAGPNVNADAEPAKQMRHLRLVSSPAALPTSFAVGAAVLCLQHARVMRGNLLCY